MPFGPCNTPAFYTAMVKDFNTEWLNLFIETVQKLPNYNKAIFDRITGNSFTLGESIAYFGSKIIIDDILAWCSSASLMLTFLECIFKVCCKYRSSFKLSKCEFFTNKAEFVGYNIASTGNSPAESKFNMNNDWDLPITGQALFSFIGLVTFYNRFAPYHEMRIKPLRKILQRFFRQPIPLLAWTPALIQLFQDIKVSITSSPVLVRFDPSKPTFLKTDWSSHGMAWILMQPANDKDSLKATKRLLKDGTCSFDLSLDGAWLAPICFGSRARICDCNSIKAILEYNGPISSVLRWSQELLAYN